MALVLMGAAAYLWSLPDSFTVYADGEAIQVSGEFETVQEVINAVDVGISPLDAVIPERQTVANPAVAISIQRAKPVILETDTERTTYFTHQTTLGAFLHEIRFDLSATDQILADGLRVQLPQVETAQLPQKVVIKSQIEVTIVDQGQRQTLEISGHTVEDALNDAGITLLPTDQVRPSAGTGVTQNMEILVDRAIPVKILVDGQIIETHSPHTTVMPILASAGVSLTGQDYTFPAGDVEIFPGDTLQVIRVTEELAFEDEVVPYESQLVPSDQFEIDTRGLVQSGEPGLLRKQFRVRFEDGIEVSRQFETEWIEIEPVPELIGYGTKIIVRTIDTPQGALEYYRKVEMRVTSYMAQTSGKPKDHPAYGITASGEIAGYGVVAVDPKVVPFRSNVYVPGYGSGFVGDTGGGVKGRWIDLGYEDDWDTFVHWSGYIDVYFLTPIPEYDRINYLIPTTLP